MDCREVQQVLSAAFDGETVEPPVLALAEEHCASCAGCAEFRRALESLAAVEPPSAPAGLAERILTAAAADARAEVAEEEPGAEPVVSRLPDWLTRRRMWGMTAIAGAAALMIGVAVLFGTGILGDGKNETAVEDALRNALTQQGMPAPPTPATSAEATAAAAGATAGPAIAPPYVTYTDRLYQGYGTIEGTTSLLTTSGTVTTALDTNGSPTSLPVLKASGVATTSIAVRYPDGTLHSFALVLRVFEGATYELTSGKPITKFGEWPTLPSSFPPPASPDGSPTFREYGTEGGVPVYTPGGAAPGSGLAIAPGSPGSDPAAGNPNWTWWVRR